MGFMDANKPDSMNTLLIQQGAHYAYNKSPERFGPLHHRWADLCAGPELRDEFLYERAGRGPALRPLVGLPS